MCLQCAHTPISQLNPSCFCDASEAMSPNCICFLVVCQVFQACDVVNRRCKYCLLRICNILNPCKTGSAFTLYLRCVIGRKAFWQYLHNDMFSQTLCTFTLFFFMFWHENHKIDCAKNKFKHILTSNFIVYCTCVSC